MALTWTLAFALQCVSTSLVNFRLLIVTPSNSASDLVAERLMDSGRLRTSDMVRLIAYQVSQLKAVVCVRVSVYKSAN